MKQTIILCLVGLGLLTGLNQCNISTANITDVKMCDSLIDNQCMEDNPVFSTVTPVIYVSCVLRNAPAGTKVNFSWYYISDERVYIDEITLEVSNKASVFPMSSTLTKTDMGWPAGNYEVVISLYIENSTPITKSFSIQ